MVIKVGKLKKTYLKKCVLDIQSLHIHSGEKVAIIGANGSGKSTLLKLMLDLIKADEGGILLFGDNVRMNENWKLRTSAFLDDSFLMDFLNVREYLYFLNNRVTDEQIHDLLNRLNFTSVNTHEHIKNLSSGNKKKVGILGALINQKDLIIFDEVCNFLDYHSKKGLLAYFKSLTRCTIVIVEHNLEFIYEFASRILVLDNGSIVKDIDLKNISIESLEDIIYKK